MVEVLISTESIALDAFLKWAGVVQTGGEAKRLIQQGRVHVNGRPESRRGRQLAPGDKVTTPGRETLVVVRQSA
jgi:ribosome-associated protein